MEHHLAQVNIAKMRAAIDDPIMLGFANAIDKINTLAESSAGFIWRYEYSVADAALLLPYDRENIVFNLSVWDSLDALKRFVYDSTHSEYIKSKQSWFIRLDSPHMALWWVPAGHLPSVDEALERLSLIADRGPCAEAFSFANPSPVSRPGAGK